MHTAKSQNGAVMVEFALVLPLILLLLFGMVSFGLALNYWIDETQLTSAGARYAAVNVNPGPGATLEASIQQQADTSALRDGATTCIRFPNGTANVGDPVEVEMKVDHSFLPIVDLGTITISSKAAMRLEAVPSYASTCP
jgi:Flp pilus assembly pilin Flp